MKPNDVEHVRLCEIANIYTGLVVARKKAVLAPKKSYKILTLKSIEGDGWVNINELDDFNSTEVLGPQHLASVGDVIVRLSYPYTAVYIDEGLENMLIPSLFAVIRADKNRVMPEFLTVYLNSAIAKKQMVQGSSGSVVSIINTSLLKELIVRIYPLEIQAKAIMINKLHLKEKRLLMDLMREKEKLNRAIINTIMDGYLIYRGQKNE